MSRTKIAILAGLLIAAIGSGYAIGAAFFPRTSSTQPVGRTVLAQIPAARVVPIRASGPPGSDAPHTTISITPPPPSRDVPQRAPIGDGPLPSSAASPLIAESGAMLPSMTTPAGGARADRLPGPAHPGPATRTPQPQRPSSLGPVLPMRQVSGPSAPPGGRSGASTVPSTVYHPAAAQVSGNRGGDTSVVRPLNTAGNTQAESSGQVASVPTLSAAPPLGVTGGVTVPETASRGTTSPESTTNVPSAPALGATSGPAAERFHVQVGSFDVRPDADALAQRLEQHGYSTSVTKDAPYRVWVGGYLDRPTADRLVGALQQIGVTAMMVP